MTDSTFDSQQSSAHQPSPQAILFDLDGTLVDSALDFLPVVHATRQQAGLPELEDARIRAQVSNGSPALVCLAWDMTPTHEEYETRRLQFLADYEANIGTASRLFPGFSSVINELELLGIRWGVVTNKHRRFAVPQLERLNINTGSLVCGDDVTMPKPAPEALLRCAKELGVDPFECWYIGDHQRDIEAARNSGMKAIAARYGYLAADEDAADWQADAIIDRADQLLELVIKQAL